MWLYNPLISITVYFKVSEIGTNSSPKVITTKLLWFNNKVTIIIVPSLSFGLVKLFPSDFAANWFHLVSSAGDF